MYFDIQSRLIEVYLGLEVPSIFFLFCKHIIETLFLFFMLKLRVKLKDKKRL